MKRLNSEEVRSIPLHKRNLEELQRNFCNNDIKTSQYTALTFLPVNFLQQFMKLSNVYFLIIMCMQMIKVISISNG